MLRKRRTLLVGSLLLILGFVVWDPLRLKEPWYHGKPISSWLALYGDGPRNYKPSPAADEALRHIGTNAVPYLLRQLHSTTSHSRVKSASLTNANTTTLRWTLTRGATNVSAKVRLMTWVENHTPIRFHPVRAPASWDHWQAYLGFQALGPLGKAAIPDLVKLAHDPSGSSHMGNVQGMKDIGLVAKLAENSSTYVAVGESPFFHGGSVFRATNSFLVDGEIAACSLAAIGADGVPPLLELLAHPSPRLKARAAVALGMISEAAEPAVPELVKSLTNADVMVRIVAADALGWIGKQPALAVPALTDALNDSEVGVKCWAADSLGRFRERATNAIPALLANFAARDYRIKGSAAVALSKISRDTTAKEVVPVMLDLLKNPDWSNSAVGILGQMKDEPDLVIPALIEATGDANKMVQHNAINFLGRFGPEAKAAAPRLAGLTNDPDKEVSDLAVRALGKINPGQ